MTGIIKKRILSLIVVCHAKHKKLTSKIQKISRRNRKKTAACLLDKWLY